MPNEEPTIDPRAPLTPDECQIVQTKAVEVQLSKLNPTVRRIKATELAAFLVARFDLHDLVAQLYRDRAGLS